MITKQRIEELYGIFRKYPKISTDSRNIAANSIFFALKGASFDGNRFAEDALAKGAAVAVVDDSSVVGNGSMSMFLVEDALEALQALARLHRQRLELPILAITGTNGKTTTKELTAAVLSRKFRVYATHGNLNNHIGVPLTLLSMTENTELGIVEIGAGAQGEIALLCEIALPDYGLITNIGVAHLEGFGNPEGVRKGKGELFDFLAASGGRAIVRSDDPTLSSMAEERQGLETVWYRADFADGIESRLAGGYNRTNIASAVAVGRLFGIGETDIRDAVSSYEPSNNRSQVYEGKRNQVVVDCYNANPSSMAASIDAFIGNDSGTNAPARVMILGDMLELGTHSHDEHIKVIRQAISSGASSVFFVGPQFASALADFMGKPEIGETGGLEMALGSIHSGCSRNIAVYTYPDTESLRKAIESEPLKEKLILLKGSRGIGLEKILNLL